MSTPMSRPTIRRRPLHTEPGLILTAVLAAYTALVFAWWPADTMIGGLSLVAWLMIAGLGLWVAIAFGYVFWVEGLEGREAGQGEGEQS